MRIIIYQKVVRLNGTYTFDRIFIKNFHKDHELVYLYEAGDRPLLDEIAKYAEVIQSRGQKIECDVCIFSSIFQGSHQIQAKKFIQMVHTDLAFWKVKYTPVNIDFHVSVGQKAAESLKSTYGLDSIIIPNMLEDDVKTERVLKLMTASRIAENKGFDRMLQVGRILRDAGKKYTWEVYGYGSPVFLSKFKSVIIDIPSIVLMGERQNIQSYMSDADYIVQLSDSEGFCYSIYEALQIEKPVIVTRWPGIEDIVKDSKNGYILEMDLSNLDIEKLYNSIPVCDKLTIENSSNLWRELFNNI